MRSETTLEPLPVDPALLERANWWFDISWYGLLWAGTVTAIAACATVLFLFLQYWSSGVRERHTEWRTTSLELQTAQANAELGKANASIAEAQKQTAALEKDAAQARLEQERLKEQLAWRTLRPEIVTKLKAELAKKPGRVNIQYQSGDKEAEYLAIQFANIFHDAGWEAGLFSATMHGAVIFGFFIPDAPSGTGTPIREAFSAVGIGFSTDTLPPSRWHGIWKPASRRALIIYRHKTSTPLDFTGCGGTYEARRRGHPATLACFETGQQFKGSG